MQRRATKYSYFSSDNKSRLLRLNLLPLIIMYIYELNDILFFIKSCKLPSPHFNIHHYITFANSSTRFSEHSKLLHTKSFSNNSRHFYFCRLLRLWDVLPHINVNLALYLSSRKIYTNFSGSILLTIDSCCVCSFHFCCPCSKCIVTPKPHI